MCSLLGFILRGSLGGGARLAESAALREQLVLVGLSAGARRALGVVDLSTEFLDVCRAGCLELLAHFRSVG